MNDVTETDLVCCPYCFIETDCEGFCSDACKKSFGERDERSNVFFVLSEGENNVCVKVTGECFVDFLKDLFPLDRSNVLRVDFIVKSRFPEDKEKYYKQKLLLKERGSRFVNLFDLLEKALSEQIGKGKI